jgi:hypothetical protein
VPDVTNLTVKQGDITNITIGTGDVTALTVQSGEITQISSATATINLANIAFATSSEMPLDVGRSASVGVLNIAARADHVHSAANLLLDGGNF